MSTASKTTRLTDGPDCRRRGHQIPTETLCDPHARQGLGVVSVWGRVSALRFAAPSAMPIVRHTRNSGSDKVPVRFRAGRFKEGVFGGDKVELLIQDLLIEADQEVVMSDAAELSPGRTLWEALGDIPDRRGAKGRRYPLRSVLPLSLAAMLAGGNDLCSIFRWGRRLPPEALSLLGLKRAPCHAMYHSFYKALDVAAAEQALGVWAQGSGVLGTVAIDGKRLRGSAPAGHDGSEGVHVVAAFASQLGAVIGQVQVAPEADEITAALALLKSLPLAGAIITGDAAFCQRAVCQGVRDRKGDYLFTVQANQPQLMADIALAFGDAFPPGADQGSGRAGPL